MEFAFIIHTKDGDNRSSNFSQATIDIPIQSLTKVVEVCLCTGLSKLPPFLDD